MPGSPTDAGVYIEELPDGPRTINGGSTSETAFVDFFAAGPMDEATRIVSFADFEQLFGGLNERSEASYAIQQYFLNGGRVAWVVGIAAVHEPSSFEWNNGEGADAILGRGGERRGIYALTGISFNTLCLPAAANLPPTSYKRVYDEAAKFCNDERAFLIVDTPPGIDTPEQASEWLDARRNPGAIARDKNAAVYFPRLTIADPLNGDQPREVGPSGTLAGLYARTDAESGVWKAPAGSSASLRGVNLLVAITDDQNGLLNHLAINSLRYFPPSGAVCWGARTLAGTAGQNSEWKYIPVRRTALYIERSIYEGTAWVVFEPNDETLWAKIRSSIGTFLHDMFRSGAFQGPTPKEAYFIKCDQTLMTQTDLDRGVVNIIIGFAPLKPAEFVTIQIQRMASHVKADERSGSGGAKCL